MRTIEPLAVHEVDAVKAELLREVRAREAELKAAGDGLLKFVQVNYVTLDGFLARRTTLENLDRRAHDVEFLGLRQAADRARVKFSDALAAWAAHR